MADELHYKELNDRNLITIGRLNARLRLTSELEKRKFQFHKSPTVLKMKIPRSSRLRGIVMSIVGFNLFER